MISYQACSDLEIKIRSERDNNVVLLQHTECNPYNVLEQDRY